MLTFNKAGFKKFKSNYDTAVAEEKETFFYRGTEVVTGYAKYLIEYIENGKMDLRK